MGRKSACRAVRVLIEFIRGQVKAMEVLVDALRARQVQAMEVLVETVRVFVKDVRVFVTKAAKVNALTL